MKKLISYFLQGVLVFTPIALTVFVIGWLLLTIDQYLTFTVKGHTIHGGGFLLFIILMPIVGFVASHYLGKKFFSLIDKLLAKLPLIKLLYNSLKDMISAFAGEKKSFDKPVLVTLDKEDGGKLVGFVTRQSLEFLGLNDHVAVYFPQSYNFAGNVLIFPASKVKPIDVDPSEVMAFIVSAGVSGPKQLSKDKGAENE